MALVLLVGRLRLPLPSWLEVLFVVLSLASVVAVMAVGFLQLFAISRGSRILAQHRMEHSVPHNLSLLCGCLHFILVAFLFHATSVVY